MKSRLLVVGSLFAALVCAAYSQTTIAAWSASGSPNAAWGLAGSGGSWMPLVGFTAENTGVVDDAGLYLYQSSSGAYSITYQLWSAQPNRINSNADGQPGYLGSATVTGSGISTTNGELVTADFSSQNITLTTGATYYLLPLLNSGSANWNMSGTGDASPGTFFNTNGAGSLTSASWTDNQGYKDVGYSVTAVSAVPEPSTYAAIFGALALGAVAVVRQRRRAAAVQN